jgi:hypothetical protein
MSSTGSAMAVASCTPLVVKTPCPDARVQAKNAVEATHPAADPTATTLASGLAAWLASHLSISRRRDAGLGSGTGHPVQSLQPVGIGYRGGSIESESRSG